MPLTPRHSFFYNDYDAKGMNAKSDAIFQMAKDFRSRGVPIDGIGLQMHIPPGGASADIEANIKRITDLGLQVQFTELDMRLPLDDGKPADKFLALQGQVYGAMTALCLKFKLCTAIQTWGFTDRHSWIPGWYRGMGAALEFDADYRPKPAYRSMVEALTQGRRNTP